LVFAATAAALQSLGIPEEAHAQAAGVDLAQLPFLSAVVFAAVYLLQIVLSGLRGTGTAHSATVICDACHRPLPRSDSKHCVCGGELEPIAYWKWETRDVISTGEHLPRKEGHPQGPHRPLVRSRLA
jgi:hypothetical protein